MNSMPFMPGSSMSATIRSQRCSGSSCERLLGAVDPPDLATRRGLGDDLGEHLVVLDEQDESLVVPSITILGTS